MSRAAVWSRRATCRSGPDRVPDLERFEEGWDVPGANADNYQLNSVSRVAQVLAALDTDHGSSLREVARSSDLSEATALRYLTSLASGNMVERDPATGVYRLGLELYRLGQRALAQRDVHRIAMPYLRALRDEFQETVNLASRLHHQIVMLEVLDSPRSLRKGVGPGAVDSWHSTSVGKAILSRLPWRDIEEILRHHPLIRLTPNTITRPERLQKDLGQSRRRGYAIDNEESDEGLKCVGAPVLDHYGEAQFAISVSGPASRMTPDRLVTVGAAVCRATADVSQELGLLDGPGSRPVGPGR